MFARINSFVVFIQKQENVYSFINADKSITLDKTFLTDTVRNTDWSISRKQSNKFWFWHIPFGTEAEDVRQHMKNKNVDISNIKIEPISYEDQFCGFIMEVSETILIPGKHFKDLEFVKSEENFWPPGWLKKSFKNQATTEESSRAKPRRLGKTIHLQKGYDVRGCS